MKILECHYPEQAIAELLRLIPSYSPPTVVFDIDDTVIEGEPQKLIKPLFNLYLHFRSMPKARIYFITARESSDVNVRYTIQDLARFNMGSYHGLFLRPATEYDLGAFKAKRRNYINRKSPVKRKININIGNRWSDLFSPAEEKRYAQQLQRLKVTRFYILQTGKILRLKLPTLWADKRRAKVRKGKPCKIVKIKTKTLKKKRSPHHAKRTKRSRH
uniref:Uncharacterized protein n=1 Tax=viral metagenome TaxID=1070528 RepID=A0A6C0BMH8_9ZZZZ